MKLIRCHIPPRSFAEFHSRLLPLKQHFVSLPAKKIFALAALCLTLAVFTMAHPPPLPPGSTVVKDGLEGPRGLTLGPDGLLYVAEAGLGVTEAAPAG